MTHRVWQIWLLWSIVGRFPLTKACPSGTSKSYTVVVVLHFFDLRDRVPVELHGPLDCGDGVVQDPDSAFGFVDHGLPERFCLLCRRPIEVVVEARFRQAHSRCQDVAENGSESAYSLNSAMVARRAALAFCRTSTKSLDTCLR